MDEREAELVEKASYKAQDIADWFLAWTYSDDSIKITKLKLQKLLYYAQAYALLRFGRPLFGDEIQAWKHGPVVPSVWKDFTNSTKNDNDVVLTNDFDFNLFDKEENQLLADVWQTFASYHAKHMENLTHKDEPWKINWDNDEPEGRQRINYSLILDCYAERAYIEYMHSEEGKNLANYIRAS